MSNKYQEALIKLVAHNYSTREEKNEHIKVLQELVDKETPMKVIIPKEIDFAYCPKCNEKILLGKPNYCCHCGQKLDWSDTDE